jgi:hypothetical protein
MLLLSGALGSVAGVDLVTNVPFDVRGRVITLSKALSESLQCLQLSVALSLVFGCHYGLLAYLDRRSVQATREPPPNN